jgi:hypothetical protein
LLIVSGNERVSTLCGDTLGRTFRQTRVAKIANLQGLCGAVAQRNLSAHSVGYQRKWFTVLGT